MAKFLFFVLCAVAIALVNTEIDEDDVRKEAHKMFQPLCELYGDAEKLENVKTAYVDFMKCNDKIDLSVGNVVAKTRAQFKRIFAIVCDGTPMLMTCIDKFKVISRPCFNDITFAAFEGSLNTTPIFTTAQCSTKLDAIIDFSIENGIDCYSSNVNHIISCVSETKTAKREPEEAPITDEEVVEKCFKMNPCASSEESDED